MLKRVNRQRVTFVTMVVTRKTTLVPTACFLINDVCWASPIFNVAPTSGDILQHSCMTNRGAISHADNVLRYDIARS